jgi:hypothetical protein
LPGQQPLALAIDPADTCGPQRADFAKSKTYFSDQIIAGVATGAVIGAAGGLVVGLITHTNIAASTAAGAGLGAAAGGAASYSQVMAERSKDQAELARNVNGDLVKEGDEIDHSIASFARLRECRFYEAARIKSEARAHRLERTAAIAQLGYQRDRFDEEIALAHQYGVAMAKRGTEFQDAATTIGQNSSPENAATVRLVKAEAAVEIPEKRRSFDRTIVAAEKSSKPAFDIDNTAKLTMRADAPDDA